MKNYSKELVDELQSNWQIKLVIFVGAVILFAYGLSVKNKPNFQTITGEQKDVSFSLEDFKRDIKSGALTPLQ